MSEHKMATRSAREVEGTPEPSTKTKRPRAPAVRKIFYIAEELLDTAISSEGEKPMQLSLEYFYHPGKGKPALFVTDAQQQQIMEVVAFAEPKRCWLIDSSVCSNGRVYMTTPVDVNFLALYHLRKHCSDRAIQLDNIYDAEDASTARLLAKFVRPEELSGLAEVQSAGDLKFYKYNPRKAMAWLAVKTRQVAKALRQEGIYCGLSAISQNYVPSGMDDEVVGEMDYLRVACDLVGSYLEADLHDELTDYLSIPSEVQALVEEKKSLAGSKRKSQQALKSSENKKAKLENKADGGAANLRNSLLDDSCGEESSLAEDVENTSSASLDTTPKPAPLPKERTLTAKQKALAKSSKGTKSIASFFKKQ